jgi:arylsulfatase A-like enzyme
MVHRGVALALTLAAACSPSANGGDRPARIILFSMDTVRADHVDGYGSEGNTPALARIAAEGVRFQNFHAASTYTIPSHASIFTGRDPREVMRPSGRLKKGVPTLAEALFAAGYRTAAFHEGGYVSSLFRFDRGFEQYTEVRRIATVDEELPTVLEWIRNAGDEPYFLFLHTYAAHFPYGGYDRYRKEAPGRGLLSGKEIRRLRRVAGEGRLDDEPEGVSDAALLYNHMVHFGNEQIPMEHNELPADFPSSPHFEADRAALMASYDERIRLIDRALDRIRRTLEELGQWEDTLLVVTSDHGEAFFEHGLQRHGYVPFSEVLKVPLIVSYPRRIAPRVIDDLAWHPDLMPTVLGLADADMETPASGRDLSDALLSEMRIGTRWIFPTTQETVHRAPEPPRHVALWGTLKYVEGHPRFGDPEGYLFDLAVDPGETTNLRAERPDVFARFAEAARSWAEAHSAESSDVPAEAPIEINAEQEEKLRALGYLGS